MRREVPLFITFVVGSLYTLNNVFAVKVGSWTLNSSIRDLNTWVLIVAAFAMGLASVHLLQVHTIHIARKRKSWVNSVLLIVSFVLVTVVGVLATTFNVKGLVGLNNNLFNNVQSPLGATMWAMVGFFICSAAYRAFRLRSVEAGVLLFSGILLMLAKAPIGEAIWRQFPVIGTWLLNVPNTAGQRAIMMGAAIGGFATAIRIILGLERGYLGE